VVDLLGQLAEAPQPATAGPAAGTLRDRARQAMAAINRGVLAYNATA
jgi:hypothetical protein